MTKSNARAWLALFGDLENRPACQHGHAECSTTPGGLCLDDVIKDAVNPPDDPTQARTRPREQRARRFRFLMNRCTVRDS